MEQLSNEELALRIKAGEADLVVQLWSQVEKFIARKATQYHVLYCENAGCEIEDLIQSGYFALLNAVHYHDPDRGFSFLTILGYSLRAEFALTSGIRGKKDVLKGAVSLDKPVGDEGDAYLSDFIEDISTSGDGSVENRALDGVYQQQLRKALCTGMSWLTEQQRKVIHARYFEQQKVENTAHAIGCSCSNVTHIEQKALDELYRTRKDSGLDEYLDTHTNYYARTGLKRFKNTNTSSVEAAVIRREELAEKWLRKFCSGEVKP